MYHSFSGESDDDHDDLLTAANCASSSSGKHL